MDVNLSLKRLISSYVSDRQRRVSETGAPFTATTPEELIEIFRHRLFITTGGRALCLPRGKNDDEEEEEEKDGQEKEEEREKPKVETGMHISQLPTEVLMNIFKWVVSSDLDVRQLEQLSMVSDIDCSKVVDTADFGLLSGLLRILHRCT